MTPFELSPASRLAALGRAQGGFAAFPESVPGFPPLGRVTGGGDGPAVQVRSVKELQAALDTPGPLWVVASRGMVVRGKGEVVVRSDNKTLLGQGLTLDGPSLVVDRCMNVIVEGVQSVGAYRDGFEVTRSLVVSLVLCRAKRPKDGGFDIVRGAGSVSLIHCTVEDAAKAILIGGSDEPFVEQQTGDLAHLGELDDRRGGVWLEGCRIIGALNRAPLARHKQRVVLQNHVIEGGGKRGLVEARTNATVLWLSGQVRRVAERPIQVATYAGHSAKYAGRLYVAPGVDLGGATAETNYRPTDAELAALGVR